MGGKVNRALLESYYQNKGDIYDDEMTEGAMNTLADQIDANWEDYEAVKNTLNSTSPGASGADYVKSAPVAGVSGTTVRAQITDVKSQVDANKGVTDAHANATSVHGATSAATANRIILRDANGRAKIAPGSAADDIAAKGQVDGVQSNLNTHAGNTDVHIQSGERSAWNAKETPAGAQSKANAAAAGVQTNLDNHVGNLSVHTSPAEKDKLAGIQAGAEVNQNAFSKIKVPGQPDIDAGAKQDAYTIEAGVGIVLTNDPVSKKTRIDAGGEAIPAPHASTHGIGGNDYLSPASIGAETPAGAQDKADAAAVAGIAAASTVQTNLDNHIKDYVRQPGYGTASGTNAKTITLSPAPTALVEGFALSFKNSAANTGAVTLNVNGLGAKSVLKPNGVALASGNLKANSIYTVRYNGTNFILQGEGGEYGTATAADVLAPKTIGTEAGLVTGTMPDRSTGNYASGTPTRTGTTIELPIPARALYGTGAKITRTDANWIAENIRKDVPLFGLVGTLMEGKPFATGQTTPSSVSGASGNAIIVNGLDFAPNWVLVWKITLAAIAFDFGLSAMKEPKFPRNTSAGFPGGDIRTVTVDVHSTNFYDDITGANQLLSDGFICPVHRGSAVTYGWMAGRS